MADDKSDAKPDTKADAPAAADKPVASESAAALSAHLDAVMPSIGVEPTYSEAAQALRTHLEGLTLAPLLWKESADTKSGGGSGGGEAKKAAEAPPKVLSEKEQLIVNLKSALETDDYVQIFDALEAAEKKGLAEHKVSLEAASKLSLFMKQMETFETLDKTATSRDSKEIELALNLAEEYFLEKTPECKRIQTIRDTMQQMFRDLEYACGVDHVSVDDQLKKMQAFGIDSKHDACVAALEKRKILFARSKVVDVLKETTRKANEALRTVQKKLQFSGGAPASPRPTVTPKTPSSGGEGKGHGRSSSMGNVPASASNPDLAGAAAAASGSGTVDITALLDEHTAAMEKVLADAKAMNITSAESAYEAAKIKFAELAMEKKQNDERNRAAAGGAGGHARKTSSLAGAAGAAGYDDDDDDGGDKKGAKKGGPKREPGQEADAKIDPYNPKSGSLPPLEPEIYAIPKLALHNFARLRSPEDFSRGVVFNRKRYQIGMLIWQSDKLERSLTKPADEKKEAAYNTAAQKIFLNVQTFMGDRAAPTGAGAPTIESFATELMKLGYKQEELRDEVYCQVIKQITCHPKLERAIAGWQLLGLVCEAFPPSVALAPHVFHCMYPSTKPDVPVAPYAKYCMFTLWNSVNEPLKPITDFTLEHVRKIKRRKMVPGKVRIYFLDGSELDLQVEPHTRVCDSLRFVFDTIKLKDRAGFGIFSVGTVEEAGSESKEGREIWVPLNSCLLDYDPQPRPSVSPVLYKAQSARLVFKRRLYQDLTSTDKLAQKLLYYQTLVSICDEGLPCSEKQLHRFLALHRVIDQKLATTPIAVANMLTAVAVKNILPHFVEAYSAARTEKYLEKVSQAKATLSNLKVSWEVLINEVREWTLFGCSYFTAKPAPLHGDTSASASATDAKGAKKDEQKGLMMGISSQGVFLVSGKDKKMQSEFPFYLISSFAIEPNNEHVSIVVRDKSDKLKKATHTHRFASKEAEEIFALMTTIQEDINSKTEVEM